MNVETLTLAAYCVAIILASLLGGWLPSMVRMTHTRTQLIMSCVAGLMLGVGLLHLVPHALAGLQHSAGGAAMDVVMWWTLIGLVVMVLLLRLFRFQLHGFDEDEHDHHHGHSHGDHHHGHDTATAHPLSWVGVALGMGLHSLIDGVALGASIYGSHGHGAEPGFSWIGLGVFLAILLHKPLDALSVISTMQAGGWSARARSYANLAFSILCPLGALLFVWGIGLLDNQDYVIGCSLAFSAGVFLCISLSDLLPEVHFHSHDRLKLTISFLLGIALAYALRFVEPATSHSFQTLPHL